MLSLIVVCIGNVSLFHSVFLCVFLPRFRFLFFIFRLFFTFILYSLYLYLSVYLYKSLLLVNFPILYSFTFIDVSRGDHYYFSHIIFCYASKLCPFCFFVASSLLYIRLIYWLLSFYCILSPFDRNTFSSFLFLLLFETVSFILLLAFSFLSLPLSLSLRLVH